MEDIAILNTMLKDTAKVALKNRHGKYQAKLIESDGTDYSVTISGMPDVIGAVVIRADEFASPKTVFADTKGECKRADFVIIVNDGERKAILCIELKARATTCTEQEIIQQLKGAQCFIAYCREIGKTFWGKKDFLGGYNERYVSIRNISISKKPSRLEPNRGTHDRPERMLKISSPHHLQLNTLL